MVAMLLVAALVMSMVAVAPAVAASGAMIDQAGCRANTLPRNDDGSTGVVDLPFTLNFYGIGYEQVFVNNNGNVTFDRPLWTYTPFGLAATSRAIVAPFFADVDTRAAGSGQVTYGEVTYEGQRAFCVNWPDVGYYPTSTDKLNSFQLLLVERPASGNTDFDIVFNYDMVQWETGGASGGSGGLGGNSARVGFSSGEGTADTSYELPGSGVNGAFLDGNLDTGLVHNRRGSAIDGRYVFSIRNGSPNYIVRRPEELFGFRDSSGYVSDPVNTGTGNFTDRWMDLDYPEAVQGMDWARTYNSRDDREGALGQGWSTLADVRLDTLDGGGLELRDVDGRAVVFSPRPGGGYARAEEFDGEPAADGAGHVITMDDGVTWSFDEDGWLVEITDWTGQRVDLSRSADGRLQSLASSTGYGLELEWSQDRVVSVTASDGRTVGYAYDTAGHLTGITDPAGGQTQLTLDGAGLITELHDADGRLVIANTFDSAGRVTEQHTATGNVTTLVYEDLDGRTVVTDSTTGETTTFQHDEYGRVVSITDTTGAVQSRTYNAIGNLEQLVDRRGATTTQTFDEHGNVLTRTDHSGDADAFTYDDHDRLVTRTDAAGSTWTLGYEGDERIPATITGPDGATTAVEVEDGLITSIADPDGVIDTFTYDEARNVVTATNGVGDTTTLSYDAAGNLTGVELPSGATTTLAVDAMGRITSETDPAGATTTTEYSPAGLVTAVTDPAGATTTFAHDEAGRVVSEADATGAETTFAYDAASRLTGETAPGGATTAYEYGPLGRLAKVTDPEGGVTQIGYDVDGAAVEVTNPAGATVARQFDVEGRLVAETDGEGHTTTFDYDVLDRMVQLTHPDGTTETVDHDAYGRVVEQVDPRGGVETRDYTAAGRLAEVVDPVGAVTRLSYDAAGRVDELVDPEGGTITLGYTPDGLLASETSPEGLTTSYGYDPAGRLAAVTDPAGNTTAAEYTLRGELARLVDPTGATRTFAYDPVGRLLEAVDANGDATTYGYDARGNRTARTNAAGHTETWAYDLADRMVSSTDPLGNTTTASYDPAGRIAQVVDPTGRTEQYAHDGRGLVTARTFGDGSQVAYGHDARGRRTSMTDHTGQTTYAFDAAGNLTEVATPDGEKVAYTWDLAGRRMATTYPDGRTVTHDYDARGLLTSTSDDAYGTASFDYDADGRLVTEALPGDDARTYGYDGAGRLTEFDQQVDGRIDDIGLTWDPAGRLASQANGRQTATYDYDPAGQLLDVTIDGGLSTGVGSGADDLLGDDQPLPVSEGTYGYDAAGNRTAAHEPTQGDRTYEFDAAGRLVSETSEAGTTTYSFDAAGRRIGQDGPDGSAEYRYDARGLLVEIVRTSDDGAVTTETRTLDGDGRLQSAALSGENMSKSTAHTWDLARAVPQVVGLDRTVDLPGNKKDLDDQVDLLYGASGRIGYVRDDGTAGSFATDVMGSAIETTSSTDLVAASIYTPYGEAVEASGHHREQTVAGQFGFRGELDTSVGLHLRAREYDLHTGQFTTVDPLDGLPGTSVETSPYHYANNDPVNWTDPLGLAPISDAELRELFEGIGWTSTIVGALIGAGRSLAERGTSASAALRARSSHGGRVMASFRWSPRGTAIARAFRSPALRGAGRAMPFVGAGLSAVDNFVIEDQSWEIAATETAFEVGGGWGGASAGFAIGCLAGPIGCFVGGAVGGVGGAVLGDVVGERVAPHVVSGIRSVGSGIATGARAVGGAASAVGRFVGGLF